eukprot:TRINITY_DN43202_c0_g1_i1.p1 TRINITY_DN43202_c0_g1~~TRINITY_DN43202_c0_g1_i1.p1  ORF type:complete len:533 (+),score=77.80 TRINITY_DN43202_c0_g1_i1:59-1600(+)
MSIADESATQGDGGDRVSVRQSTRGTLQRLAADMPQVRIEAPSEPDTNPKPEPPPLSREPSEVASVEGRARSKTMAPSVSGSMRRRSTTSYGGVVPATQSDICSRRGSTAQAATAAAPAGDGAATPEDAPLSAAASAENLARRSSCASSAAKGSFAQAGAAAAAASDGGEEVSRLRAQVESLQRMLGDRSAENRVQRLQEDLQDRARRIKELEKEKAGLKAELERCKKESTAARRRTLSAADTDRAADARLAAAERKAADAEAAAAELQADVESCRQQLMHRNSEIRRLECSVMDRSDMDEYHAEVASLQETVCVLRQSIAERDAALTALTFKLDKAQEAILAGINWEASVKLDQTRAALEHLVGKGTCISPERMEHVQSHRPKRSRQHCGVHLTDVKGSPLTFTATRTPEDGVAVHRSGVGCGSGVVVRVLSFDPKSGTLTDQRGLGSQCILSHASRTDGSLSRLAALCDACYVAHDLAATISEPCVLVASHTIDSDAVGGAAARKPPQGLL